MRTTIVAAAVACLLGVADLGIASAGNGPTNCGSLSVGPGSLGGKKGGGASCMLLAYRSHCRTARYLLSAFGIDTIASRTFVITRRDGLCGVDVTMTFEIVPNKARPAGHGRCRGLRRTGNAILAYGCTGTNLPATVSLTAVS